MDLKVIFTWEANLICRFWRWIKEWWKFGGAHVRIESCFSLHYSLPTPTNVHLHKFHIEAQWILSGHFGGRGVDTVVCWGPTWNHRLKQNLTSTYPPISNLSYSTVPTYQLTFSRSSSALEFFQSYKRCFLLTSPIGMEHIQREISHTASDTESSSRARLRREL